jgi:peptidoglycan hydrolase-like protein with peptidoglycan-binding domain
MAEDQQAAQRRIVSPVPSGTRRSSRFGEVRGSRRHGGTDYATPLGTSIKSAASGRVARSYDSDTFGKTVIVNHGPSVRDLSKNVFTLYAHGSRRSVADGQDVAAGQEVIKSGSTGRSTGPHLHYEVIETSATPFDAAFFGNFDIRFAPDRLAGLLGASGTGLAGGGAIHVNHLPANVVYENGDQGPGVTAVQEALELLGYDVGSFGADGRFGGDTTKAVQAFQTDAGIAADGKYGPNTRAALLRFLENKALADQLPESGTLENGAEGEAVRYLQEALLALGYDLGLFGADGDYGPVTEAAVSKFQGDATIAVNGKADEPTIDALRETLLKGGGVGGQQHPEDIKPYAELLKFIASGEGGYNSMNNGTGSNGIVDSTHDSTEKIGKKLTEMTLADIMELQQGTRASGRKLFAVGRYQIIPKTMIFVVEASGLESDAVFTPDTQDRMGVVLINQKRPRLGDYLHGRHNDVDLAMLEAAKEWASLPVPSTGKSFYGNGNAAHHKVEDVRKAMIAARKAISGK